MNDLNKSYLANSNFTYINVHLMHLRYFMRHLMRIERIVAPPPSHAKYMNCKGIIDYGIIKA